MHIYLPLLFTLLNPRNEYISYSNLENVFGQLLHGTLQVQVQAGNPAN
jgi:hypothetical protein